MSLEVNVHDAQIVILRELLFHPSAGFAQMQKITGMSSDHFNFHIQKLVELKLVEKTERGKYTLSPRGKEYANKLDTDRNTIERQPKTAVLLAIERKMQGKRVFLLQERLKQPYYGFIGYPTGKIRWGETIIQTAERELMEETGLTASHRVAGVYHELAYQQESGEQLEDKIFFVIHCTEVKGDLVEEFEGGCNAWMTPEEERKLTKTFPGFDTIIEVIDSVGSVVERRIEYAKELF